MYIHVQCILVCTFNSGTPPPRAIIIVHSCMCYACMAHCTVCALTMYMYIHVHVQCILVCIFNSGTLLVYHFVGALLQATMQCVLATCMHTRARYVKVIFSPADYATFIIMIFIA